MIEPVLNMLRFAAEYDFSTNDTTNVESAKKKQLLNEATIALCVNMIKVDNKIDNRQLDKLKEVKLQSSISEKHFNTLLNQLNTEGFMLVDYTVFKNNELLKKKVFQNLVVLADMDGKLHENEKGYLYDVAKNLDIPEHFDDYIKKSNLITL